MSITYVGAGTAAHGNNVSVTPTLHASSTTGDLLLVFDGERGTSATCADSLAEYTQLGSVTAASHTATVLARAHDGSEGDPQINITAGTVTSHSAVAVTIRGAVTTLTGSPAACLDGAIQTQSNGGSDLTIEYPALTVTNDNCIVFLFVKLNDDLNGGSFDTPAGFTPIGPWDTTLGADHAFQIYYQIQTTATNISAGTVTASGGTVAAVSQAMIFAIKASAATGHPAMARARGIPGMNIIASSFGRGW